MYVVEGEQGGAVTLSHKEFRREEEAMTFYEQLGEVLALSQSIWCHQFLEFGETLFSAPRLTALYDTRVNLKIGG